VPPPLGDPDPEDEDEDEAVEKLDHVNHKQADKYALGSKVNK